MPPARQYQTHTRRHPPRLRLMTLYLAGSVRASRWLAPLCTLSVLSVLSVVKNPLRPLCFLPSSVVKKMSTPPPVHTLSIHLLKTLRLITL